MYSYEYVGSVKDSVVGEERIAQYLLAVLNIRGTPLHWKHLNDRVEQACRDSEDKHEYNLKDLRPKKRNPPNLSDMLYIEVKNLSDMIWWYLQPLVIVVQMLYHLNEKTRSRDILNLVSLIFGFPSPSY